MKVQEVMSRDIKSTNPDSSVKDAAELMLDFDIGSVPVFEGNEPVGFITDRDIAIRCTAKGLDPDKTSVRDCMSQGVFSINENETLENASLLMCDKGIYRLLVTNDAGTPVGFLNLHDIPDRTHSDNPTLVSKTIEEIHHKASPRA